MSLCLESQVVNKVRIITFCNTKKKNAIKAEGYDEIANILSKDATDNNIIATIFTGKDEYFTSGNNFEMKLSENMSMEQICEDFSAKFLKMIQALIKYPKLIVVVVNGPAIGIGFTMLGLADIVYASNTATFSAPFVKLGLCVEGCASFLMPRILGRSKASEIILLGHKISAEEAAAYNLISKVVKKSEISNLIQQLVSELSAIPLEQLIYNKKLITDHMTDDLLRCAAKEVEVLLKCQTSEFFLANIIKYLTKAQAKL